MRGPFSVHNGCRNRRSKVRHPSDTDTSDDARNGNDAVSDSDKLSADKTKQLTRKQDMHLRLEERWRARYVKKDIYEL